MKISKKAYYGLRAAVCLADADEPISAHKLAQNEYIPEDFLEKILQKLRISGIIESTKGVEGGYMLTEKPVSVWDILKSLDGPVRTFSPPLGQGTIPCDFPSHCRTNAVLRQVEEAVEQTLSGMTISQMSSNKAQDTDKQDPNKTQNPNFQTKPRNR